AAAGGRRRGGAVERAALERPAATAARPVAVSRRRSVGPQQPPVLHARLGAGAVLAGGTERLRREGRPPRRQRLSTAATAPRPPVTGDERQHRTVRAPLVGPA